MTDVLVTGIGQSQIGRRMMRSPLSLTAEAAGAAIADAGLTYDDIDGVSTWPGGGGGSPGFSGVGVFDVQNALGLSLRWFSGGAENAGQLGAIINAYAAVHAGLADHVLCFRTVWEATAQAQASSAGGRAATLTAGPSRVGGWLQWQLPFGAISPASWVALVATRHFHDHGTTREQLGAMAVNSRRNAGLNPAAVYRNPITLEDYLGARMISDPLGLLDCDVPVDGSTAVVVSRGTAATGRRPRVRIEAVSSALSGRPSWDQHPDLASSVATEVGTALWASTDVRPAEVDVAAIYDGFTMLTLVWLEALGLVPRGEGGPFLEGGSRIALDGELPLNTGGGQLSAGRLHGFGHLHEATLQLYGAGGARQVPGDPRVAIVAAGGGPLGGALLLVRD